MLNGGLRNFVDDLAKQLKLSHSGKDPLASIYQIEVDGTVCVNLCFLSEEHFMFSSNIYQVGEVDRHALFETLLKSNLLGIQTEGGILAYDDELDMIVLSVHHLLEGIDFPKIKDLLGKFCENVDKWSSKIYQATTDEKNK